jgi:hypothetical protein
VFIYLSVLEIQLQGAGHWLCSGKCLIANVVTMAEESRGKRNTIIGQKARRPWWGQAQAFLMTL